MSRLRAFAALALVLALTGCMKVDARMAINDDDTVSGFVVMALDKRLTSLTGQSQDQLIAGLTLKPDALGPGTTVEPYADDAYVGRRWTFTNVPLSRFHGTDQVSMTLAHDGRTYLLNGVADLRTVNLTDPAVQRFADLFAVNVSVTFPGKVVESNGVLVGNTVTWTPKAGQSTPMHAKAESGGIAWWPWGVAVFVLLIVVATVVGVVLLARRRPAASPEPALVETRHDML
jgi:hypothetical protein